MQVAQEVHERQLGGGVHAARRLVEREQLGIGGEGAGDERALALPAGELAEALLHKVLHADAGERAPRLVAIGAARPPPRPERRHATHERHLARGERPDRVHVLALRHVADREPLAPRDAPGDRREGAEQRAEERGLAAAVRADDREEVARRDGDVEPVEQRPTAVPDRRALEVHERRAHRVAPAMRFTSKSTYCS